MARIEKVAFLFIIILVFIFGLYIYNDTEKQVEKCLKNGNSQNYCLYKANN